MLGRFSAARAGGLGRNLESFGHYEGRYYKFLPWPIIASRSPQLPALNTVIFVVEGSPGFKPTV